MMGRSHFRIRQAQPGDVPEIVRIYIDSWNAGFGTLMPVRRITDDLLRRWANDLAAPLPHRWWVAETDGRIAGFVGICPGRDHDDPAIGEIDTIAVDPHRWRGGIGRRLMAIALDHLKRDGYREAILWTLSNYERGQRFYEATGWEIDGAIRADGAQVRYRRKLLER